MKPIIVYMGTPDFACPSLERLAAMPGVEVGLVVTQPDRLAGRGRQLQPPPVKRTAEALGLPVYQSPSLRTAEQRQPIVDIRPDIIVVAAFGLILGKSILELPDRGCINLHASLLPRYRGASPISAAILMGDGETGVTLMQMERGLDTGPMLAVSSLGIDPGDTTESLTTRLSHLAADLIEANIMNVLAGTVAPSPQPHPATLTRPLMKSDGWVDWSQPSAQVERHVRAMWAWPRAWTALADGSAMQVHRATVDESLDDVRPGQVRIDKSGLRVRCGDGWLRVETGQLPGGKPLTGPQLATRPELASEPILGTTGQPDTRTPMIVIADDEPPQ